MFPLSFKKLTLFIFYLSFFLFPSFFCFCFAAQPPRYEITARLDAKAHRLTARQKVLFTNNSAGSVREIYFHLYPHRSYTKREISFMYRYAGYFKSNPFPEGFQSGDLFVCSVNSKGNPLAYSIEGKDRTILKIDLPGSLGPGESTEVELDFTLVIPHSYGRFGWHKQIITLARWYPLLSVLDEKGWHNYPFYIYHQPFFSDSAHYTVELTLGQEQTVASTGYVKEEKKNNDATKTLTIETDFPVRDFAMGISPAFSSVLLKEGPLTIRSFYLKGDEKRASQAAQNALSLMKFYSRRFGEYPYKEYSIVPSYLAYGGCQSSNLVFIDTRVYKFPGFLDRYFDFLVSHETGHQWFYNLIGSDEYKEMFMDEGINSFWILRYLEDKYGDNASVMVLPKSLRWLIPNFSFRESALARYLYLAKHGLDGPVISSLSSFQEPSSIFALTYGKGAQVLDMLRLTIGDEVFGKVMRRLTSEYRFKNISLSDFIAVCNEEAKQDLNWFFDRWLKSAGSCDYAVRSVEKSRIVLENRGGLSMPVEVKIVYADDTHEFLTWDGDGKTKIIPRVDQRKVTQAIIDPESKIVLDIDRTNNYWPRKFLVKPVPLYFFAYEIPLFLPRDTYTTVAGPSFTGPALGGVVTLQKPYDYLLKASSQYDFNDKEAESKLGFEVKHVAGKQVAAGVELFSRDKHDEKEDVYGGKVYLRKELWPASYGLFEGNDHVTFYCIRDQKLDTSTSVMGFEDSRNLEYKKKDEAILGITGVLNRSGPYLDPVAGWRIIPTQEVAGHFIGGKEFFWRSSLEANTYHLLVPACNHKVAARIKAGWGGPSDKHLFNLGGYEGLRGYSKEDFQGSRLLVGSLEYRLPLATDLRTGLLDNLLSLDMIQAVAFFDAGKVWQNDFSGQAFKKDAGFGLRVHFNVAGFLEKAVLRIDVAKALNEPKEETHVWVGFSQAF